MPRYDPTRRAWRLVANTGGRYDRRRTVRYLHEPNTAPGRRKADAAEARLRAEVVASPPAAATPRPRTFGDVALRWQERAQGPRGPWAAGTRRTVNEALTTHILPALGARPLGDITHVEIEDLYDRWSRTLAASNVRRKHGIIRRVFATAERRGELPGPNPMRRVDPGGGKAPERMHMPTNGQVHDLATKAGEASPTAALFVYVAAYTAARRGSVLALRWRNIDLEAGLIYVERAISLDEGYRAVEKSNKGGDPYPVRISGRIVELLRDARRRAAETALALGQGGHLGDLYVFSSDGGRAPWSVSHPSKVFRLAARDLGLSWARDDDGDGGMTLHDLRHYGASMALRAGIPAPVVARRMGCTVANVLRTYSPLHTLARGCPRRRRDGGGVGVGQDEQGRRSRPRAATGAGGRPPRGGRRASPHAHPARFPHRRRLPSGHIHTRHSRRRGRSFHAGSTVGRRRPPRRRRKRDEAHTAPQAKEPPPRRLVVTGAPRTRPRMPATRRRRRRGGG